MWDRIARKTEDLAAYENAVASVRRRSMTAASVTQGTESIAELVAAAGRVKAAVRRAHVVLGRRHQGCELPPPEELKRTSRIVEKSFCQGTCSRIFDVVRCMIVVDDMSIAAEALSRLARSQRWRSSASRSASSGNPRAAAGVICMVNGVAPHHRGLALTSGRSRSSIASCSSLGEVSRDTRYTIVVRVATELLEKMGLEKYDRAARIGKLAAASGETAQDFRAKGVEAADLVAAACFEPHELKDAGLGAEELSAAGLPLSGILQAGFDASDLRGCSDADDPGALLHAGYDFDEVAAAFRID